MDASVKALGYVVIETTDPQAWLEFGTRVLGLQAVQEEDRLLMRMDDFVYRLDVRSGSEDGIVAIGWDVGDAATLSELSARLTAAGYAVEQADSAKARERQVDALAIFRDPDDQMDVELYWALRKSNNLFVSPTGANFVTDGVGLGHVFQAVSDEAAYRRLYMDILGFRLSDHIDFPNGGQGVFLHCNSRHHSMAFGQLAGRKLGIGHIMMEVSDLEIVGRAYDKVLDGAAPLFSSLGKHTNDKMTSFYCGSPSAFGIEYGTGGIVIDDDVWRPTRYSEAHYWGHHRSPERIVSESVTPSSSEPALTAGAR
ncbi:MAG: glyoxalase [Actinobacteria bacterium]|jgi:3,4-dihydroxy-9,10-secoandrosta-1,3,5(10)-triene-9,17-dione 4,5-dioxygenase|uniref:Unannotated protein n=1 Tax=freshwater metagenome TaxID=449393 RepID=A0A6J7JVY1_9ZZZZ|nr:glyoxalase [Actinomycetota bacterium]